MMRSGKTLPASLKVKNTFIDVRTDFVDDDDGNTMDPFFEDSFRKRQSSEPAPLTMQRQLSTRQTSGGEPHSALHMMGAPGLLEEEDEDLNDDEDEGRPMHMQARADTLNSQHDGLGSSPGIGRQVTEVNWPTWGAGAAPTPMGLQPGLDMYMPSFDGSTPWGGQSSFLFGAGGACGEDSKEDPGAMAEALAAWQQEAMPSIGSRSLAMAAQQAAQRPAAPAAPSPLMGGDEPPRDWQDKTTVMLRNLPNKYNQSMLLEELNSSGFLGTFDFLYLPIDQETNANRGYCFINFTDPGFAWMLKMTYEGRKMGRFNSDKVVSVAPAALQGFEANYAHYSTARVNRGDPSTRPLFLRESSMAHSKPEGRRRGGRRSQGSLIDIAARSQVKTTPMGNIAAGYIGLQGPSPPGALDAGKKGAPPPPALPGAGGKGGKQSVRAGPKGPPHAAAGASEDMRPRFCPFCGGEAQPEFRFCQFCGTSLNFSLAPQPGGDVGGTA